MDSVERKLVEPVSKTQRKKAMHDLQALGEALVLLPPHQLEQINLPETLLDALQTFKATRSFEGRRRQMQYIGKLMRQVDSQPIREAVANFQLAGAKDTLLLHQAELWRSQLIATEEALTQWVELYPTVDIQLLRTLIRKARKDQTLVPEERNGRGYRELFQYIKTQLEQAALDASDRSQNDDR